MASDGQGSSDDPVPDGSRGPEAPDGPGAAAEAGGAGGGPDDAAPGTGTTDATVGGQAPAAETAAPVVVHVAGEVRSPGVVELPAGSRVSDAVAAAGGPGPEADVGGINLARVLTDGEQVLVPRPGEQPAPVP
ncbi:SLBB domain-containing protein, partial [Georgenia sp. 10Sc9-8]|nr:SLBB domain-containing protein [Georgenia halotolerans]